MPGLKTEQNKTTAPKKPKADRSVGEEAGEKGNGYLRTVRPPYY